MSSTPEGRVKADIRKELAARGFWQAGRPRPADVRGTYYMPVQNGMGVVGIPDFVGTWKGTSDKGRRFDIEAKAPGEGPTPNQRGRHEETRAAGGIVLVVDDVSTLIEFFDTYHDPWSVP